MQQLRLVRVLAAAWFAGLVVLVTVMLAIASSWGPETDTAVLAPPPTDLGPVGAVIASLVGIGGLIAALVWRNRVSAAPIEGPQLVTSFVITIAVAEAGALTGLVFALVAETLTPFWMGAGLLLVSLVLMVTAFSLIEVTEEGGP